MRWLAKIIYFKILKWRVTGFSDLKSINKTVIIAAPHTSWHDFFIGILLRSVIGVKTHFLAKKSLFKWPIGWILKQLGGIPVDRKKNKNQVENISNLFNIKETFRLALSPEGTRNKVTTWKTGFYYIAKMARVPIIMFTLDFDNKENRFSQPFYTTENKERDFREMKLFFKDVNGKIREFS